MTPPPAVWTPILRLPPEEIEALKAGKRVTRTYPEALPYSPPPLLPEDFEALKGGKRLTKMVTSGPSQVLRVGDTLPVMSSERGPHKAPALLREDLQALRVGKTVTKTSPERPRPFDPNPDLRVRVVEYRLQGSDHVYTFEAA